jgi:tricorn protease
MGVCRYWWGLWVVILTGVGSPLAAGQEPIRFARTPDISPDGTHVAFSYLGDIWVVPSIGGVARPVTMHEAHDINPVFSPDGQWIAFSSNRHGQYDVYVVSVQGGRPRRLTYDSAPDMVLGWTPDGRGIVFSSLREVDFPSQIECYVISVEGGSGAETPAVRGQRGVLCPEWTGPGLCPGSRGVVSAGLPRFEQ